MDDITTPTVAELTETAASQRQPGDPLQSASVGQAQRWMTIL